MWWIVVDCWIVASLYTPVFSCVTMEHQSPNRGTPVWSIAVLCSVSPRSLAVFSIISRHSIVLIKLHRRWLYLVHKYHQEISRYSEIGSGNLRTAKWQTGSSSKVLHLHLHLHLVVWLFLSFSLRVSTYVRLKAMFRAANFGGQFAILVVACHLYFLFFFRYYFYFIWQIKYVLCSVKCKRSFEHHRWL